MKSRRGFPIVALVCFVFFGAVGTLSAEPGYISIRVDDNLDLGSIPVPDGYDFSPTILMYINASIDYHIEISMSPLTHTNGTSTIVPRNFQMTPLGLLLQTHGAEMEVAAEVKFNITTAGNDMAGKYHGTLMITAMPGPP